MHRRLVPMLLMAAVLLSGSVSAGESGGDAVDVVVVSGNLDGRSIAFVTRAIENTDADVVVLQMDVPAVLDADVAALIDLIADPPVPVAVWVGPQPAVAHGAAVEMLAVAQIRGAAPGVLIGWSSPRVAGGASTPFGDVPAAFHDDRVAVTEPVPGLVDVVQPSIGQFVVGLHGRTVTVRGETRTLDTARVETIDGVEVVKPSANVRFVEEGLIDRILHLTVRPEAAFFFLLAGLTFAALEFYSAGPGVAAAVAAMLLLLAGYGIAVLPVSWFALAATLVGLVLYLIEFQRNDLGWRSAAGTVLLVVGGLRFVDAGPQIVPVWWMVLLGVATIGLFFAFALTTVVRSRFSTQTIGRDHLVGRVGVAREAITPDGVVEIDGARWRARSTRQSGIAAGDRVVIVGIDGIVLLVDPENSGP